MNLITDPEFESLCPPLSDEGDGAWTEAQEARVESDHAKLDQVRIAQNVAGIFDEFQALVERHADHAAELEQVRDELDRTRQDAGLWRNGRPRARPHRQSASRR